MMGMGILGAVLLVAVLVALTGAGPKGSRPAARTNLMHAGRVVLALLVLVGIVFWLRGGM